MKTLILLSVSLVLVGCAKEQKAKVTATEATVFVGSSGSQEPASRSNMERVRFNGHIYVRWYIPAMGHPAASMIHDPDCELRDRQNNYQANP